jgi:hypothetical protein
MRDIAMAEFGTQPPGDFQKPGANAPLAAALRIAPGFVPNPLIASPLSAAGEYAAQKVEGSPEDLTQVGIAAAVPPAAAAVTRFGRGLGRTATRMLPSLFEKAQGKAAQAGAEMVESLRPGVDAAQLARGAEAAGEDILSLPATKSVIRNIRIPLDPANKAAEPVVKTIGNLKEAMGKGSDVFLADLEAIRKDIGPLVGRGSAEPRLKALYGAIIQDLEKAATSGSPGAAMARDAATAFKQELGASRVGELLEKASPIRTISGAETPALNIGSFAKSIRDNRESLTRHIGPDAMRFIDRFIHDFRSLPPDVAFNGWNRALLTLGGSVTGAGTGAVLGGVPGAILGALTPEVLTNMAKAGANPAALNQYMTTLVQAARAATVAPAE